MNNFSKIIALSFLLFAGGKSLNAQITHQKIGDNPTMISPSAVLDIESTNKGILMPRVNLTGTLDQAPIPTATGVPANGLTVFNLSTTGDVTPGYYYWSTSLLRWVRLADQTSVTEPWRIQNTTTDATTNTQHIYQNGKVAIGAGFDGLISDYQLEVVGNFKALRSDGTYFSGIDIGNLDGPIPTNIMAIGEEGVNLGVTGKASMFYNTLDTLTAGVVDDADRSAFEMTMGRIIANNITGTNQTFMVLDDDNVSIGTLDVSNMEGTAIRANFNSGVNFYHGANLNTVGSSYSFPTSNGTANQVLVTNGVSPNAQLSWQNPSALVSANNGLTKNPTTGFIQLGGDLVDTTTIATTISGTTYPLLITGLPFGDNNDQIMVVDNGQLKTVDQSTVAIEPWNVIGQPSGTKATANTESIYQMGNVAIGATSIPTITAGASTINPALHVAGDISTTGKLWTTNSVYADYVFDYYFDGFSKIYEEYKFKSLKEVAEFIRENKHLPGVTPISEITTNENGYTIDLTKLSMQQLEKLEELYLHVIEMNDTMNQKDQEIKDLQNKTKELEERLMKLERLIEKN